MHKDDDTAFADNYAERDQDKALREQARAVLDELDARIHTDDLVGSLTVSQQQIVEIAKVYAARPKIVVLDEPTSSLSEHETQALFRIIGRMTDAGLAVIYISHRLREVLDISQQVTVLRDGRRVETRPTSGISAAEMIRLMVGRDLTEVFPKRDVEIGDVVLDVRGLTRSGEFDDISLTVRSGEILGLAGLVGAGRTEVARAIFGLDHADAGSIEVDGTAVRIRGPRDAVRAGIAYVPEDRKRDGIVPQLSIKDNISLSVLDRVAVGGWIRPGTERVLAQQKAEELTVSPPAIAPRVDTLSGGNQQKTILARTALSGARVLLMFDPTRGIDPAAKLEVYRTLRTASSAGAGVLLYSTEIPELIGMSDRILVLYGGEIVADLSGDEMDEERVMAAAVGRRAASVASDRLPLAGGEDLP